MAAKLSATQQRVLDMINENGEVTRNFGGGGAPKGFNILSAQSLWERGLVSYVKDEERQVHIYTSLDAGRVADVDEAHTLALEENNHRTIAQAFPVEVAEAAETNPEYAPAAYLPKPGELAIVDAHTEALEIHIRRDLEDSLLEDLTISQAAAFEATGELPEEGLTDAGREAIRRAYARRGACPWTNVIDVSGDVEGPCTRWAGHPGGCRPAETPAGGYPSPYAVATLATLIKRQHCLGRPDGVEEAVEELEERGFLARIPGIPLVALTEAGKEFTRRWVLSSPAEAPSRASSYGTAEPCSSCNSRNAYHDC